MAKNNAERINRLVTYSEMLKARLAGTVPAKFEKSPEAFKQMIEIDLRKTLATLEKLRMS